MSEQTRKALILPGAGARGAYQVGVLKGIATMLPKHAPNPFAVISGTSAGAINAAVLATQAARFSVAVAEMERVWSNFKAAQVYRTDNWTMLKTSLYWLSAIVLGGLGKKNSRSLLDSSPLRELLTENIKFSLIERAINRGHLEALAITVSAYSSARSVTFFQGLEDLKPWARVRRIGRPAEITVEHLLASAAVPFVFSPVQIGGEFYGDGAMRHRAPLSSAIHLGAERMLVIGVRDEHPDPEPLEGAPVEMPNFALLAGYMLDTLFMDGLYADLEQATRVNVIMEQLEGKTLEGPVAGLRPISTLIIVPKEDIRQVAERHVHELPRAVRLLLGGSGAMDKGGLQLISYLLFESGFTRELIEMGLRDAMEMEEDLRAFLFDQPMETVSMEIKRDLFFEGL
ncbi:MAG: patatin-like phospholipase family protein [Gammaproteobacteria bacterium]|nr:patatin-like phospholipase family protein [Gammaproteobacteria bacterium]MCZ6584749.1 patatin-like phospholipase family protein [Gammaproteobacteria bacterium]